MALRRFTRVVCRNGNSLTIALPQPILTALNLARGHEMVVSLVGDAIVLTSVEQTIGERVRHSITSLATDASVEVKA